MVNLLNPMLMGPAQSIQRPPPMAPQATAGAFPAAPRQSSPMSGIGSRLKGFLAPEIALPAAQALMTGRTFGEGLGNAFGAAGQGMQVQQQREMEAQKQNATRSWLASMGLQPPEVDAAMSNPAILTHYLKQAGAGAEGNEYFGTPIFTEDEDGNIIPMQLSKSGDARAVDLQGNKLASPTKEVDIGTHIITYDRFGKELFRQPKENYQEAFDTGRGGVEGKRAGEMPVLRTKALASLDALDNQRTVVDDDINRAISEIQENPNLTTGLVGGLSSAVPGSPAYGLAKKLETIKANVGFDKLQSMRENSPTGGALGQVSDFENRQLQSVFGNLEQAQTAEQLIYNLQRLQQILSESKDARRRAFARDFGDLGNAPPAVPPPPSAGDDDPLGLR